MRAGIRPLLIRRVLILPPLFIAVFILTFWIGWLFVLGGVWELEVDFPKIDFFSFYSASSLALDGAASAAYDAARMSQEQAKLPGDDSGYQPWRNPPVYFFFVLPLSLLPLSLALGAWVAGTGGFAMMAIRRISREPQVLFAALAFPAVFWTALIGQNAFLTAGLLAWGMVLLKDRPVPAGVLLGLLTFKPQFFPLAFIALLAGRHRSAAIASIGSAAALALASLAVFGLDAWDGFFAVASRSSDEVYDGLVPLEKMQSVSAMLLAMGAPATLTQVLQGCVSVACAAFVFWLWRKDIALEYKAAGLALATLLATPYSYHYDLTIMGLAILWLGLRFRQDGWRLGDAEVLLLAWLTPFVGPILLSGYLGFSIGPLVILALVAALVRRVMPMRRAEPVTQAPAEGPLAVTP